jgi:hypothetical protein
MVLNTHYDHWCYLPVMGFVSFDGEADLPQSLTFGRVTPAKITWLSGKKDIC